MTLVISTEAGKVVGRVSLAGGTLTASSTGTRRLADYALRKANGDAGLAYRALGTFSNGYLDVSEEPDTAGAVTGQAVTLAAGATVAPGAMRPPGLPVPGDPAAVSMFTAHRIDSVRHELSHAAERMQAAKAATGDLRAYHGVNLAVHLDGALNAARHLTANIRDRYPAEAAELEAVKESVGLARGYELNARPGMISLDLPPGTIAPVPDGVADHHITVVYLGPDVDDEAFARACDRAKDAAAAMPGPLSGTAGGIGSFKPSDGSDGKVPAWAGVVLPGAERLRSSLEDLSASEYPDWKPHVTLAYVAPGEPLPAPVPATPVTFTHLSVHRGDDEAEQYPLGGSAAGLAGGANNGQVTGLAAAVSGAAKAATTAHLLETTLHELTHASRHAQAMLEGTPGAEWEFDADHCEHHLGGAAEHAGKLAEHFTDNYPAEGRWLAGLAAVTAPGGEGGSRHAAETISGQLLDLAALHGRHIPGTAYTTRHGWIPLIGQQLNDRHPQWRIDAAKADGEAHVRRAAAEVPSAPARVLTPKQRAMASYARSHQGQLPGHAAPPPEPAAAPAAAAPKTIGDVMEHQDPALAALAGPGMSEQALKAYVDARVAAEVAAQVGQITARQAAEAKDALAKMHEQQQKLIAVTRKMAARGSTKEDADLQKHTVMNTLFALGGVGIAIGGIASGLSPVMGALISGIVPLVTTIHDYARNLG